MVTENITVSCFAFYNNNNNNNKITDLYSAFRSEDTEVLVAVSVSTVDGQTDGRTDSNCGRIFSLLDTMYQRDAHQTPTTAYVALMHSIARHKLKLFRYRAGLIDYVC